MLTIGRMAERYHMLPHQVRQQATTYDLMIMDVLATYDNFQAAKQTGGDTTQFFKTDYETLKKYREAAGGN